MRWRWEVGLAWVVGLLLAGCSATGGPAGDVPAGQPGSLTAGVHGQTVVTFGHTAR